MRHCRLCRVSRAYMGGARRCLRQIDVHMLQLRLHVSHISDAPAHRAVAGADRDQGADVSTP